MARPARPGARTHRHHHPRPLLPLPQVAVNDERWFLLIVGGACGVWIAVLVALLLQTSGLP